MTGFASFLRRDKGALRAEDGKHVYAVVLRDTPNPNPKKNKRELMPIKLDHKNQTFHFLLDKVLILRGPNAFDDETKAMAKKKLMRDLNAGPGATYWLTAVPDQWRQSVNKYRGYRQTTRAIAEAFWNRKAGKGTDLAKKIVDEHMLTVIRPRVAELAYVTLGDPDNFFDGVLDELMELFEDTPKLARALKLAGVEQGRWDYHAADNGSLVITIDRSGKNFSFRIPGVEPMLNDNDDGYKQYGDLEEAREDALKALADEIEESKR